MNIKRNIGYGMNAFFALVILAAVLTISVFASSGIVYAITGTNGAITLNSGIGTVSYSGNSSSITAYGIGEYFAGNYSTGAGISGRFGIGSELSNGSIGANINITLLYPANDSGIVNNSLDLAFKPVGTADTCSLYIDGSLEGVYTGVVSDSIYTLSVSGLPIGRHQWNVSCAYNGNSSSSKNYVFTKIVSSTFDSNSTDFAHVNMSAISNLTLSNSGVGSIIFSGLTDLSSGPNLDSNIDIGYLNIYVNSAALGVLNKSATLTMHDVPYSKIIIFRDSTVCTDCSVISNVGGTLKFSVTGFSNYTVTSNSKLAIFDDTDSITKHSGDNVTFYANYTNITSSQAIVGTCMISLNVNGWTIPTAMTYNSSNGIYYYISSFNTSMLSQFNVNCTNIVGFENLSTADSFIISSDIPSTFGSVSSVLVNSSRTILSNASVNVTSGAGNLTEIGINAKGVSSSWQGYYGNITGKILLEDANNNTLYNWNMANAHGEIYAARNTAVKWYNIRCANSTELSSEDTYLGIDNTYAESILNTFHNTTNFNMFYAGNVKINTSQNCYATNIYNSSGQQSQYYSEIVLTDSKTIVYTGLIDNAVYGFDGRQHDFEMLVGENGQNNEEVTTYYFYVEMG